MARSRLYVFYCHESYTKRKHTIDVGEVTIAVTHPALKLSAWYFAPL